MRAVAVADDADHDGMKAPTPVVTTLAGSDFAGAFVEE